MTHDTWREVPPTERYEGATELTRAGRSFQACGVGKSVRATLVAFANQRMKGYKP